MRSPTPTPWSPLLSRIDTRPSISSKNMTHGLDARALQAGMRVQQQLATHHAVVVEAAIASLCVQAQYRPPQTATASWRCTCLGNAYSLGKERRQSLLALTHILAEKLWAFDRDVVELGLGGDRPGQQRFTAARGAVQQDACKRQTLQADSNTRGKRTKDRQCRVGWSAARPAHPEEGRRPVAGEPPALERAAPPPP